MQQQSVHIAPEPRLTIGAVARATGFSPDTLRVWQKRYGFPVPRRKPSGHRLYSSADVRRLRRISEALARGHRPGQVVPLAEPRLESLRDRDRVSVWLFVPVTVTVLPEALMLFDPL